MPFRGCNCSDAAGTQIDYQFLDKIPGERKWDDVAKSPYFDAGNYQYWYDDPTSLRLKKELAKSLNLGGWGMWNAQSISYDNATLVEEFWSKY